MPPETPRTPSRDFVPREVIDRIKQTVSIEQVLGQYGVELRRQGAQLVGLSPFREEQTPSFYVKDRMWCDQGLAKKEVGARRYMVLPSGKAVSGDVFGLVMGLEDCDFKAAAKKLRDLFCPDVATSPASEPAAVQSPRERAEKSTVRETRARTDQVLDVAENPVIDIKLTLKPARLLLERAFTQETLDFFQVGWTPAGLFRGRIVYPVHNVKGQLVAYAGRAVKEEDAAENGLYRFPPKFKKGLEIWNLWRVLSDPEAREQLERDGLVLVEGMNDVMMLWQNGIKNAGAIFGSDLTPAQRRLLLEHCADRRFTLAFDDDEAGRRATASALEALQSEAWVRVADYSRVKKGERVERPTEPEHLTRSEALQVLRFTPVPSSADDDHREPEPEPAPEPDDSGGGAKVIPLRRA